jgi:hypothetical protein
MRPSSYAAPVSLLALALALATPIPISRADRASSSSQTVYLNFSDGTETLTLARADDAAVNQSSIIGVPQVAPYPAFAWPPVTTGATTRGEVIRRVVRRVHELFLPYNVLVTTVRPATGPYTMVLIGGGPQDLGITQRLGGVAYQDCRNQQQANVVFAFPETLRGSEHALAVTIAQEAGHAFGLEHTNNRRDIMHPEIDPMQAMFPDEESLILGDRLCNDATQNSHRLLLQTVGVWPGDSKPIDDGTRADRLAPRLSLLSPAPERGGDAGAGAVLAQPLIVSAEAEDEAGIDRLVLSAASGGAAGADLERSIRHRPPFIWSLAGFPAGPLVLTVTAYDASGNTTVVAREVQLGAPPAAPGGCTVSAGGPAAGATRGLPLILVALGLLGARRARRPCTRRAGPL